MYMLLKLGIEKLTIGSSDNTQAISVSSSTLLYDCVATQLQISSSLVILKPAGNGLTCWFASSLEKPLRIDLSCSPIVLLLENRPVSGPQQQQHIIILSSVNTPQQPPPRHSGNTLFAWTHSESKQQSRKISFAHQQHQLLLLLQEDEGEGEEVHTSSQDTAERVQIHTQDTAELVQIHNPESEPASTTR
jgi:hypothetical protein